MYPTTTRGRIPGPLGVTPLSGQPFLGAKPAGSPAPSPTPSVTARPIVYLDPSWTPAEQGKILDVLQQLTDDKLKKVGDQVVFDGLGSGAPQRKAGTLLLRGLQHPTTKVVIVPQTSSLIPDTKKAGNDIQVELAFSSNGNFSRFDFFEIVLCTNSGDGGAVKEAEPFVVLAHELIHALRMLRNTKAGGSKEHPFIDEFHNAYKETVWMEELVVVGLEGNETISENAIRREHNIRHRAAYASPTVALDKQGVKPQGPQPSWWPDYPTKRP